MLRSGTGEELGIVLGIQLDRRGLPRRLTFQESPGAPPRHVPLEYVRQIRDGFVDLAGPRQGYHITRVRRT